MEVDLSCFAQRADRLLTRFTVISLLSQVQLANVGIRSLFSRDVFNVPLLREMKRVDHCSHRWIFRRALHEYGSQ